MANGKIRVRLRAFDVELIDQSAKAIVQAVQKASAKVLHFFESTKFFLNFFLKNFIFL